MDSSKPFGRKIIEEPKSKKKKLSSNLLEKKLKIKAHKGFYKDMKKRYPMKDTDSISDRVSSREFSHSQKIRIRKAQEAFKAAKKASRKAKK
tara:strand:+ start:616 stop:891 length:276 start_codon:yes stop_codon:yes gene_type:complete